MSTERLSAKDFLGLYLMDHPYPDDPAMIQAAEEYAAQEVEQHTKQLREERDLAVSFLNEILQEDGNRQFLYSAERRIITDFLNQLNQEK